MYNYFLAYSFNLIITFWNPILFLSLHITLITIAKTQHMIAPCPAFFLPQLMIPSTSYCQSPMILVNLNHVNILHRRCLVMRQSKNRWSCFSAATLQNTHIESTCNLNFASLSTIASLFSKASHKMNLCLRWMLVCRVTHFHSTFGSCGIWALYFCFNRKPCLYCQHLSLVCRLPWSLGACIIVLLDSIIFFITQVAFLGMLHVSSVFPFI